MTTGIVSRLDYPSPRPEADRILLLMLPGAGIRAGDFAAQGMISVMDSQTIAIDVAVLELDLSLYLADPQVAGILHEQAVLPAQMQGYQRIWFLGISLGGMGALLYASAYSKHIEGLFLLAPFLGTRGTIAALTKAGGFDRELHAVATTPSEQHLLEWIAGYFSKKTVSPKIYLGYARQDRFSSGQRLLANCLPENHVSVQDGDHDWPTWRMLWQDLVSRKPFTTISVDG